VGGRLSLLGSVYGVLAVNAAKTAFSEAYPNLWMFLYGSCFMAIVIFLPKGLAGIYEDYIKVWIAKLSSSKKDDSKVTPEKKEEVNHADV
jgi:urea transport system permease protein